MSDNIVTKYYLYEDNYFLHIEYSTDKVEYMNTYFDMNYQDKITLSVFDMVNDIRCICTEDIKHLKILIVKDDDIITNLLIKNNNIVKYYHQRKINNSSLEVLYTSRYGIKINIKGSKLINNNLLNEDINNELEPLLDYKSKTLIKSNDKKKKM